MPDDGFMTISAAQADSFYTEVLQNDEVWTIQDPEGIPSPLNAEGVRAMPFWSLRDRAEDAVSSTSAYADFNIVAVPLQEWRSAWLTGMRDDGMLVGINWTGGNVTGADLDPEEVERSLDSREFS